MRGLLAIVSATLLVACWLVLCATWAFYVGYASALAEGECINGVGDRSTVIARDRR